MRQGQEVLQWRGAKDTLDSDFTKKLQSPNRGLIALNIDFGLLGRFEADLGTSEYPKKPLGHVIFAFETTPIGFPIVLEPPRLAGRHTTGRPSVNPPPPPSNCTQ
jgi:hypothetical protein